MENPDAPLTAAEVRDAQFGPPRAGRRGYRMDDVDALLDSVVARLEGRSDLTAAYLQTVRFRKPPIGSRGYREDEVDQFMVRIARTLETAEPPQPAPAEQPRIPGLLTAADVRAVYFRRPPFPTRGYDTTQVDDAIDRIIARLEGRDTLTVSDVRALRFGKPPGRLAGYRKDDVDALMAQVTDTLTALDRLP